jgi:copper transport protein
VKGNIRHAQARFWSLLMLIAVLLLAWPATIALAHANLIRSDPAAGAALVSPPQAIVLEYSEALDPAFTSVELLDAQSGVVVRGPGVIDPAQPRVLRLALPTLPDGVYSASWKARSATDGHVSQGMVSFSIGAASPPASLLPPVGAPDPATALPPAGDALFHSFNALAAAVVVGSLFFGVLIWRPTLRRWAAADQTIDGTATELLKRLAWIGAGGLFLATMGLLLVQAALASQGSFWNSLSQMATSRTGMLDGARLVLLVGIALFLGRPAPVGGQRAWTWWMAVALGVGMLLTFSLQSHAAAGPPVAILLDWVHMAAMSAWIGGLLPLMLVLRLTRGQLSQSVALPLDKLVPNFSRVALLSVSTLALTGAYSALPHVRTLEALLDTTYGRALIVKLALVGLLLALGAVNLLFLSPLLRRAIERAARWLQHSVRTELTLGLLVLLTVGVLTTVAPAFDALAMQRSLGFRQTVQQNHVKMVVRIAPAKVGDNEFGVDVFDKRPGADAVPLTVLLRFSMVGHSGTTQVEAVHLTGPRYTARGSYLSMSGRWQVEVILRRSGFDDVRHTCDLVLQ